MERQKTLSFNLRSRKTYETIFFFIYVWNNVREGFIKNYKLLRSIGLLSHSRKSRNEKIDYYSMCLLTLQYILCLNQKVINIQEKKIHISYYINYSFCVKHLVKNKKKSLRV